MVIISGVPIFTIFYGSPSRFKVFIIKVSKCSLCLDRSILFIYLFFFLFVCLFAFFALIMDENLLFFLFIIKCPKLWTPKLINVIVLKQNSLVLQSSDSSKRHTTH